MIIGQKKNLKAPDRLREREALKMVPQDRQGFAQRYKSRNQQKEKNNIKVANIHTSFSHWRRPFWTRANAQPQHCHLGQLRVREYFHLMHWGN